MEKGKVPIGAFVKIMYGHKAWLGEHKIDGAELAPSSQWQAMWQ